ncbi:hypothetical protein GGI15_001991 [Coemansia interrupta]|uniref:WAC domain-containing protein n=1 Tax=Coemansia interrupta TaxID=1126814 RepID=A0A9W8HFG5_9FUNG|nr:hypothetical protein GGI15_001991 [Coemansia interrupta]
MPLLDGFPVPLVAGPALENSNPKRNPSNTVPVSGWLIRFTGETFYDYDSYLDRITFYRKPQFVCKHSRRPNLTYEQALLSERAEEHCQTGIGFSDMLICEMLTFLSQSSLPISQAVDALYYRFQYDFFIGEHIDVRYPGTDGAMYECFVVHAGPLPNLPMDSSLARDYRMEDDADAHGTTEMTKIAIERLGDMAEAIIAYEQRKERIYTVRLYDVDGLPIDDSDISVSAQELSRSRNVFTKVALRQFLDDNMQRGPRPGSPWVVCHWWRERFRIPYLYGGEARLLRSSLLSSPHGANGKSAKRNDSQQVKPVANQNIVVDPYEKEKHTVLKPVRKFPVDDLDFVMIQHVKYNDGVVWALRRKNKKQLEPSPEKTNGKVRQITDFFSVKSEKPDDEVKAQQQQAQAGDAEAQKDETLEKEVVEEEEEALRNRWPEPMCVWQVPHALVSRMLSTYMFLSCFSTPIRLTPFSLDYFESSLVYGLPSDTSAEPSSPGVNAVYRESAIALLNMIAGNRRRMGSSNHSAAQRIEDMVRRQNASITDVEDNADSDKMDVDVVVDDVLPPVPPVSKPATVASTRNGKRATTRMGRPGGRIGSSLVNSSSVPSSPAQTSASEAESDSDNASEVSIAKVKNPRKAARGGRRVARSRRSNGRVSSTVSSRAVSEDESETKKDPGTADVDPSLLRPHALLRHLSRTWALEEDIDSDSWAQALAGWVIEAHADYFSELDELYTALWSSENLTLESLEAVLWKTLGSSAELRLVVLELLVCECSEVEQIREYLEQTSEMCAELKRERLEIKREIKRIAEAEQELDKIEAEDQQSLGLSREQGRKEKEVELQRQKERRKLGESARTQQRRLDNVERDLRRNAVGRLTPLGSDRFLNRYYFLDGIGDCPLVGSNSGRLLVQPPSLEEINEAMDGLPQFVRATRAIQIPSLWTGGESPVDHLPPVDHEMCIPGTGDNASGDSLENSAEMMALARRGELWGYYATTAQVDALRRWLEPRGRRDAALEAELELVHLSLGNSIRKRCHTLDASFEARVRARELICERINSLLDTNEGADGSPELAKLHEELAEIDRTHVPRALLPPQIALGGKSQQQQPAQQQAGESGAEAERAGGSSRASSVEAASSVDLFVQQATLHASTKRGGRRGRRPRSGYRGAAGGAAAGRRQRPKTIIDDFLQYSNKA